MSVSHIQCFMLEPMARAQWSLRRYHASAEKCPGPYGYHNTSVVIGEVDYSLDLEWDGDGCGSLSHDDPRWPSTCACGHVFTPEGHWQDNRERLFRCPDGSTCIERRAPAGAMWFARYYEKQREDGYGIGPDGHALMVMLPDGTEWHVDGPSRNSTQPWSRSGVPPLVCAQPSIMTSRYHGYLGGPGGSEPGVLVALPDSQT